MLLFALGLMACGPKAPPPAPAVDPLATRPAVGTPAAYTPPAPTQLTLSNGATLWVVAQPGLPLVSLRLHLPGGAATDPSGHPGLTVLADEMVMHGAGTRDAAAFAAQSERLALDLWTATGATSTTVALDAHADQLDVGLDLFADAVLRPTFDPDEVALVREQQVGDIRQSLDDPRTVASTAAWATWYGDGHPLSTPTGGTESGLTGVGAPELVQSWSSRAVPSRATFVVTGAVEPDALLAALDARFADWETPAGSALEPIPPAAGVPDGGPRLVFVDVPGASQTTLRVHLPGWASTHPDAAIGDLAIIALGGTFTSRLNRLLREEKGYTYGARARSGGSPVEGAVVVTTAVQRDVTAPALVDLLGELKKLPDGVSDEEVGKAAGARRTGTIEAMSSRESIAQAFLGLVQDGRDADALATDLITVGAATPAVVNATLGQPSLDRGLIVVAGDLSVIRAPVEEAVPGAWVTVEPPR